MKTCLIVSLFLVCAIQAFAAEPALSEGVIAEAYSAYDKSVINGIRVMKNGDVNEFIGPYHEKIAKLAKPRVLALRKAIDALEAAPLTANEADAKPCGKEELKLYRVVHTDGKVVTLVKSENCIKYRMEGHQDRELKHIIQGLEALAALAQ